MNDRETNSEKICVINYFATLEDVPFCNLKDAKS